MNQQPNILLAEDNLPWIEDPLCPSSEQEFFLEIPVKEKDLRHWAREHRPEQMASVAAAGKRARVEVRLKELSAHEREVFAEAKQKELNCWVYTSAIQRILRTKLNPEQILKSRWVLAWKASDNPSDPRKAKARLVVLGYQDPKLTEVARDSPTLSREGRSLSSKPFHPINGSSSPSILRRLFFVAKLPRETSWQWSPLKS